MFMYFILYYYAMSDHCYRLIIDLHYLANRDSTSYATFLATVRFIPLVLSMIHLYHLPH